MTIAIRPAAPADAADIDAVLTGCFPRPDEAMLVKQLAIDGELVLVLVAHDEERREVAGLVALSRMQAEIGGDAVPAVAMAPVAVLPEFRRAGVAEALIAGAIEQMRKAGALLLFVLGEPGFYERFGFSAETAQGFDSPYAGPFFMALELQGGLPCGPKGAARHADAFAALAGDA
ncbi:GNAT family N-acetyltransferase [Stakelama saccharophila]|uniref:N-acetyltransferase n=1 Tax=Stakelama saccharophila TaxID=3075605 RepID=A0ABZ0BC63_9SPHN|nr:N-acetyltransferase [Stakelama sp. W311]WNO53889.1 N-acetyltransferase [Stakelama sp. W311]